MFVGDTIHDYEMSKVLGCNCVLIPRGHQNKKILNLNTMLIDNDFKELMINITIM